MSINVNRTFQQYVRPRLPLPAGNTWTALVTLVGRLRHVVAQCRQACGDFHATAWAPEWTSLAQQFLVYFLVYCVAAESGEGPVNKILSIGRDLNETISDRKLDGPQGFAELVSPTDEVFYQLSSQLHPDHVGTVFGSNQHSFTRLDCTPQGTGRRAVVFRRLLPFRRTDRIHRHRRASSTVPRRKR